jgi:hypothetical protein
VEWHTHICLQANCDQLPSLMSFCGVSQVVAGVSSLVVWVVAVFPQAWAVLSGASKQLHKTPSSQHSCVNFLFMLLTIQVVAAVSSLVEWGVAVSLEAWAAWAATRGSSSASTTAAVLAALVGCMMTHPQCYSWVLTASLLLVLGGYTW